MTIKEIETRTGLPRASVRFYEREGFLSPSRGENGYRDYCEEDCQTLLKIKLLRQLGCSLEEIRSLQSGSRSMDSVLRDRLTQLETAQSELDETERLCRQLWEDQVEWDTIRPQVYLAQSPGPTVPETVDIRFRIPWRRYLARWMDGLLYAALWEAFLSLFFRVNILERSLGETVLDTGAALALMLVLEPCFLHRFGTTPGKALLGLRLTRSDGSFLGWMEAFYRTLGVILVGLGLMFPVFSTITAIYGYYCCRKESPHPWSLEDEAWSDGTDGRAGFWDTPGAARRAAQYVGVWVLVLLWGLGCAVYASTPPNRGDLTVAQFAENYNHLNRFSSAPDTPVYYLNEKGRWEKRQVGEIIIEFYDDSLAQPHFETEDGTITQVSFSRSYQGEGRRVALPTLQAVQTVNALLGKGAILFPGERRDILRAFSSPFSQDTYHWTIDGWDITLTADYEGYIVTNGYLFPVGEHPRYFQFQFIMTKVGQDSPFSSEVSTTLYH